LEETLQAYTAVMVVMDFNLLLLARLPTTPEEEEEVLTLE